MVAWAEVGYGRSQAAGEFSSLRQDASDDAVHSMVACSSNAARVESRVLAAGVAGGGPPGASLRCDRRPTASSIKMQT